MDEQRKDDGAFWTKEDKNGNKYLSGFVMVGGEKIHLNIFKNHKKQEGSKQPDWRPSMTTPQAEKVREIF